MVDQWNNCKTYAKVRKLPTLCRCAPSALATRQSGVGTVQRFARAALESLHQPGSPLLALRGRVDLGHQCPLTEQPLSEIGRDLR
jgi:hypothetical protein